MPYIAVNDVFDELTDENKRLRQLVDVFIRFKSFCDLIVFRLRSQLAENDCSKFEQLSEEVNQLLDTTGDTPDTKEDNELKNNVVSTSIVSGSVNTRKSGPKARRRAKCDAKHICDFTGCGKQFKTRDSLRHHIRKHLNTVVYRCDVEGCQWSGRSPKFLVSHMNGHNGVRPFVCDQCAKAFTHDQYLKRHIELMHKEAEEPLICGIDDCPREFRTAQSLKNHQKACHIKEKRFPCNYPNCSFRGITGSVVKQHFFNVHSSERPFVCAVKGCDKAFKAADKLREHMRSHTSERPFKCPAEGCDKAFINRSTVNKHWRHIHGPDSLLVSCDWPGCEYKTRNRATLREHVVSHTAERNFACTWPECDKRFKRAEDLKIHHRIHTNERPFACLWPGCQYRCSDSANLYKHKRVHIKA